MRNAFCETAPVLRLSAFAIDGAECRVLARERNCLISAEVQGFRVTFFFIRSVPIVRYTVLHYSRERVSKLTTQWQGFAYEFHAKSSRKRISIQWRLEMSSSPLPAPRRSGDVGGIRQKCGTTK
jgi:hypothetical protein